LLDQASLLCRRENNPSKIPAIDNQDSNISSNSNIFSTLLGKSWDNERVEFTRKAAVATFMAGMLCDGS